MQIFKYLFLLFLPVLVSILSCGFAKVTGCMTGWKGKVGNIVFSMWKGIQVAKTRTIPTNPQSEKQTENRHLIRDIVEVLRPVSHSVIYPFWNPFVRPGGSCWANSIKENMNLQTYPFDLSKIIYSKGLLEKLQNLEATYDSATGNVIANFDDVCYSNGNPNDVVGCVVVDGSTKEVIFCANNLNMRSDNGFAFTLPPGLTIGDINIFVQTSDLVPEADDLLLVSTSQHIIPTPAAP